MKRKNITSGIFLILLGLLFLAYQFFPDIFTKVLGSGFSWPWIIIGIGLVFFLSALLSGTGDLAVPGFIIGGIGFILNYQNQSGDWASWSYLWTLIPGFVGLGTFVAGILDRKPAWRDGINLVFISAILFFIFGSAFNAIEGEVAKYWPVLLILLGLWTLVRAVFRKKSD